MNEYRIKVSVKNNLLLTAIEEAGYKTQSEFAKAAGIRETELGRLLSLKSAPITRYGEFSLVAKAVMEALGACPTDLWTEEQLTMELPKNTAEATVGFKDLMAIQSRMTGNLIEYDPSDKVNDSFVSKKVNEVLDELTPRQKKIIQLRFGVDGTVEHTYEEIGDMFGVTRERIRQIEAKAIRNLKMSDYKNNNTLRKLIEENQ
jgi:RNA polymerase sigma factor (sigma-70 family)